MARRRSPESPQLRKEMFKNAKRFVDKPGVSAVSFAWDEVFTESGFLHDPEVVKKFQDKSVDTCWKAVLYVELTPEGSLVHTLLTETGECYATLVGPKSFWTKVDTDTAISLRRLHSR